MTDYLIRIPAEWVTIDGADAWIDADRLAGVDGRPFPVVAELPADAINVKVDTDLDDQVDALVQAILDENKRFSGDYAIFIQSAVTPERPFTNWSWYYKPAPEKE